MVKVIRIERTGGTEVLDFAEVEVGESGPGQICIRHTAIGLNFRRLFPQRSLPCLQPAILGMEGAGVVVSIDDRVDDLKPGNLVAHASGQMGSYSEE